MSKYLRLYNDISEYNIEKRQNILPVPSISLILKPTKKVSYYGMVTITGTLIYKGQEIASDICAYSGNTKEIIFIRLEGVQKIKCVPIGVVVIPSAHNVYSNRNCGIMSFNRMSSTNSEEGHTKEMTYEGPIYFGINGANPTYFFKDLYAQEASTNNYITFEGEAALASNKIDNGGVQSNRDVMSYHDNTSHYRIDSPYVLKQSDIDNGDLIGYESINYLNPSNSLFAATIDVKGKENTKRMTDYLDANNVGWKNGSDAHKDFQAASACWKYCPNGTKQGDWYFPSLGELGYLIARWDEINKTLLHVKNKGYAKNCDLITFKYAIISSTKQSDSLLWMIRPGDFTVLKNSVVNTPGCVRAFMQV